MKRHASSSIQSGRERRPRQDPVSCTLCRSKKLKCSRQQPCTNCVARGAACDYQQGRANETLSSTTSDAPDPAVADILARLQQLEKIVQNIPADILKEQQQYVPASAVLTPVSTIVTPSCVTTPANAHNAAFISMEAGAAPTDRVACDPNDRFVHIVAPISQLAGDMGNHATNSGLGQRIWLPDEQEAYALFAVYARTSDYMYHVTHFATIRNMIKDVYGNIKNRCVVHSHEIALLLSILAIGSYFSTYKPEESNNVFPSAESLTLLSELWRTWALDVLDQIRRTGPGSIEELQATIILSLLNHNLEGFSERVRILHSTALSIAQGLQLHIMDSPDQKAKHPESTIPDIIAKEVKRRLWWHLVASDWLMANVAGPQQGIYSIQPRQFMVHLPRNLNDKDLEAGEFAIESDDSMPTEMSFHILRARGAELTREIVDTLPPPFDAGAGIGTVDYEKLLRLEKKTDDFLYHHSPFFFRFDDESRHRSKALDAKFPQLPFQRAMMSLGVHHSRIRMHRPFLVRASQDTRYEYSRRACLDAARRTMQVWRFLCEEMPMPSTSSSRIVLVLHHVFTATLILALDLSFVPPASKEEEEQGWEEVRDACRTFDAARKVSPVASMFLNPLMDILKKHHQDQDRPKKSNPEQLVESMSTPKYNHISIPNDWPEEQGVDGVVGLSEQQMPNSELDIQWEDIMNFAPNQEPLDWDQLFADLDACYMY